MGIWSTTICYKQRYEAMVQRYDSVKKKLDEITGQIAERRARAVGYTVFSKELKKLEVVTEFDERLWGSLVEYVTVGREKEMTFRFREGTVVTV